MSESYQHRDHTARRLNPSWPTNETPKKFHRELDRIETNGATIVISRGRGGLLIRVGGAIHELLDIPDVAKPRIPRGLKPQIWYDRSSVSEQELQQYALPLMRLFGTT